MGNGVSIVAVTTSQEAALGLLSRRETDIVVNVPSDAARQIASGTQAVVPVYFNEVDPLRRDYITYLVYTYINEINKQTLAAAASEGQASAGDMRASVKRLRDSLAAVEQRMDKGDVPGARTEVQNAQGQSLGLQAGMVLVAELLTSQNTLIRPSAQSDSNRERVSLDRSQEVVRRLNTDLQSLNEELSGSNPDRQRVRDRVASVRKDLDDLDILAADFQRINPLVLASPFYAKVENKAPVPARFTSFYAPGVLILLLQHIAVTLAALSMVRERLLGTLELFRVSPASPGEILGGKYASFMIFLGIVAAILLALLSNNLSVGGYQLSLGVPILGDWALLVLTLALVIFASVGLGFVIAGMSKSESQAVQISMIVLLASVFFGGFFLRLETFWLPIRFVSYALPVTYGINSLQVVMLRGGTPAPELLVALLLLGTLFGLIGYILFRREFRKA